jgi:hypothetical protein
VNTEVEESTALEAVTRQSLITQHTCAVVNSRVCQLAIALELLVVTTCSCAINPITNPNLVCSHTHTRDSMFGRVQHGICFLSRIQVSSGRDWVS